MEQYFQEIISILWAIIMSIGAFWLKRMSDKLDALVVHREECLTRFADRESNISSHKKLFESTEDHEKRITKLEADVEHLKIEERG